MYEYNVMISYKFKRINWKFLEINKHATFLGSRTRFDVNKNFSEKYYPIFWRTKNSDRRHLDSEDIVIPYGSIYPWPFQNPP